MITYYLVTGAPQSGKKTEALEQAFAEDALAAILCLDFPDSWAERNAIGADIVLNNVTFRQLSYLALPPGQRYGAVILNKRTSTALEMFRDYVPPRLTPDASVWVCEPTAGPPQRVTVTECTYERAVRPLGAQRAPEAPKALAVATLPQGLPNGVGMFCIRHGYLRHLPFWRVVYGEQRVTVLLLEETISKQRVWMAYDGGVDSEGPSLDRLVKDRTVTTVVGAACYYLGLNEDELSSITS